MTNLKSDMIKLVFMKLIYQSANVLYICFKSFNPFNILFFTIVYLSLFEFARFIYIYKARIVFILYFQISKFIVSYNSSDLDNF